MIQNVVAFILGAVFSMLVVAGIICWNEWQDGGGR